MIGEARSTSFTVAPRLCFFRCRTFAMTGRRRAKRDGNPTAQLLGAPVDCVVGRPLAKHHKRTAGWLRERLRPTLRDYPHLRVLNFCQRGHDVS
jgi:hypothetical protein